MTAVGDSLPHGGVHDQRRILSALRRSAKNDAGSGDMAEWKEIKRITGADGRRRLTIMEGPHGRFRFDTMKWIENDEDSRALDSGYWTCDHFSGLYESAVEAEEDARRSTPWLRQAGE